MSAHWRPRNAAPVTAGEGGNQEPGRTHEWSRGTGRHERRIVRHVERWFERILRAPGHDRPDDALRQRCGCGRLLSRRCSKEERVGPPQVPREVVTDPALEGKVPEEEFARGAAARAEKVARQVGRVQEEAHRVEEDGAGDDVGLGGWKPCAI